MSMFGKSKHPEASRGELVLFLVRTLNISQLLEGLSPEQAVLLLRDSATTCESIVKSSGGALVRVDGHCVMAAWIRDRKAAKVDYCGAAQLLIRELQSVIQKHCAKSSMVPAISVSITKGTCVFEREGTKFTHLFGGSINRVEHVANRCSPQEGSVILVDKSMKDAFENCPSEEAGDGVCKISVASPCSTGALEVAHSAL